jgi:hypothetical protein
MNVTSMILETPSIKIIKTEEILPIFFQPGESIMIFNSGKTKAGNHFKQ